MRHLSVVIALVVLSLSPMAGQEEQPPAAVTERLTGLAVAPTATEEDRTFLETCTKEGDVERCIATAALFKHWPLRYRDVFVDYFRIAPGAKTIVLADSEINDRVNAMLRQFKGRHPMEVSSRIYLSFRRQGIAARRRDGSEMALEMIFRGAVFTGISNGRREEVLRLSALADGKELPNQAAEPIRTAVTPPAGAGDRASGAPGSP